MENTDRLKIDEVSEKKAAALKVTVYSEDDEGIELKLAKAVSVIEEEQQQLESAMKQKAQEVASKRNAAERLRLVKLRKVRMEWLLGDFEKVENWLKSQISSVEDSLLARGHACLETFHMGIPIAYDEATGAVEWSKSSSINAWSSVVNHINGARNEISALLNFQYYLNVVLPSLKKQLEADAGSANADFNEAMSAYSSIFEPEKKQSKELKGAK